MTARIVVVTMEHEHEWGEVEQAIFTGNPYRRCKVYGCNQITLDIDNDYEEDSWYEED
jgi:hypothetical protein